MRISHIIPACLAALALTAPSEAQATRPGGVTPVVFKVLKVSPAQSGLHIPRDSSISITFNPSPSAFALSV